ncbi:phage tail assembly chaperone [Paracoccus denitrificans]|uniref:phage tail assembly chaperone n=1 Tax=Paracoccus denitrificans TaxID=266 RepID=UPI0033651472
MNRLRKQLCAAVTASLTGQKGNPPETGRALWNAFQGLSVTRTYHPAGPNPIQPSEVLAWCQLHRMPMEPRHVEILLAMDQAYLDHAYAAAKRPEGVKAMAPVSKTPLTAGLLDAMFG